MAVALVESLVFVVYCGCGCRCPLIRLLMSLWFFVVGCYRRRCCRSVVVDGVHDRRSMKPGGGTAAATLWVGPAEVKISKVRTRNDAGPRNDRGGCKGSASAEWWMQWQGVPAGGVSMVTQNDDFWGISWKDGGSTTVGQVPFRTRAP